DENQYSEEVVDENRELSDEEKAELMKKYDSESNTRNMKGIAGAIVFILLLSFSIFQLYTGAFGQFIAYIQRTVHLGSALTLIFYYFFQYLNYFQLNLLNSQHIFNVQFTLILN